MATVAEPRAPESIGVEGARPFPVTADLFHAMIEEGLFPEHSRVFLREYGLFQKMAKTIAHGAVGGAFVTTLGRYLPRGWSLLPEGTVALSPGDSPLPDLTVLRDDSPLVFIDKGRYPGPGDVGLVIEIAVTSLAQDLGDQRAMYARAGVPVYWVADVKGRRVVVHSHPRVIDGRGEYETVESFGPGASVPLVLDGSEVVRIPYEELLR